MRRPKLRIFAIALMATLVGVAACNGDDEENDTGMQDTGQMADAGDIGGDAADGTAGDADAVSDAGDTGPTREECLGGDPLSVFCAGTVAPECQKYCEDADVGTPDGGSGDGGSTDGGSTDAGS